MTKTNEDKWRGLIAAQEKSVSVRRQREQAMDPTRAIAKLARCAEST